MKYIRKAKNTTQAKLFPDDFVTETVDEALFNSKHEALGGWELVTDEECEAYCNANDQLMKDFVTARSIAKQAVREANAAQQAIEDAEINAEFEAFKAWKLT